MLRRRPRLALVLLSAGIVGCASAERPAGVAPAENAAGQSADVVIKGSVADSSLAEDPASPPSPPQQEPVVTTIPVVPTTTKPAPDVGAGLDSGLALGGAAGGKRGLRGKDDLGRQAELESATRNQPAEKRKSEPSKPADALALKFGDKQLPTTTAPSTEPVPTGGTFVHAGTNPFIETATDSLSTFAIDVDTGSFTLARRFLRQGQLPPDGSVRVEEWVNAMHYSYAGPTPTAAVPFSVLVQGAPSPIAKNTHLVRVALQGKRVSKSERGPTSLVFLADVSGSMDAADKLPLARDAMHLLIDELRDDDCVAIATYAGETRLALPSTMIKDHKAKIHAAIDGLHSGGGTNMGSGMELAYREAQKNLGGGRSARVVVLSDGDANIGRLSHQDILKSIRGYVSEGVMLSTVGFGTGNYNDNMMEQLADAGNGNYSYVDSKKTAERVFVHELDGTLETIAQDVKIQVEWNKDVVKKYRLVGYENRDVADKDFRNDKKDAGEIGAGHAVTALYELELSSARTPSANLGMVRVRAKQPRGVKAVEVEVPITAASLRERPNDLDNDALTATAVALAAEILRASPYAEGRTLGEAASLLREAAIGPHAAERLELARELLLVEPRVAHR